VAICDVQTGSPEYVAWCVAYAIFGWRTGLPRSTWDDANPACNAFRC
jgi:hypothetical protein